MPPIKLDSGLRLMLIVLSGVVVILNYGHFPMAAVVWVLAIGILSSMNLMYGDFFSPLSIFTIGFLLPAVTIAFLPYTDYYLHWKAQNVLWLAIFAGTASFALGQITSHLIFVRQMPENFSWKMPASRRTELWIPAQDEKLNAQIILVFFILGIFGFANNIGNIISAGGLDVYTEGGLRDAELTFGANTWINYIYFLNALVVIVGMIHQARFGYRHWISGAMVFSFLALILHGIKSTFLFPSVMTLFAYYLAGKRPKLRTYLIIGAVLFLGFQTVTVGRDLPILLDRDTSVFDLLTYRTDKIFLYLSSAYTNLQEEILNFQRFQHGEESLLIFSELIKFLSGNRNPDNIYELSEPLNLYHSSYNTGTYLRENYRDFGWYGIVIFSFFYGAVSTYFYFRYRFKSNVRNIGIYSIICTMLFACFFSSHFFKIQYLYWIIMFYVAFTRLKTSFQSRGLATEGAESG